MAKLDKIFVETEEQLIEIFGKPQEPLGTLGPAFDGSTPPLYCKRVYYVIKRKGMNQYLKHTIGSGFKEEDKWGSLVYADRFLSPDFIERYAKRMLGHDNFEIKEMQL